MQASDQKKFGPRKLLQIFDRVNLSNLGISLAKHLKSMPTSYKYFHQHILSFQSLSGLSKVSHYSVIQLISGVTEAIKVGQKINALLKQNLLGAVWSHQNQQYVTS